MFLQLDPALSLNDDGHGTRTSLRVTICGLQLFRLSGEVIFAHSPTRYIHPSAWINASVVNLFATVANPEAVHRAHLPW